ncbi:MAG: acyl-ACP thioesterase domain-containing protein [Bacteroidota bacterium]
MAIHPKLIYRGDFNIRTGDIDSRKRATLPAFIDHMQEAAMQNVIELGLSVWDLEKIGISWVLMRMHLYINRLPMLGEKITVTTNGAGFEKFFTYRDYRVHDEKGDLIAYAPSTWLLMDTESRRMTRIPQFILDHETPAKEDCLERISHKLPKFTETHAQRNFQVEWHMLDFNEHLNNVAYIQWMLETLQDDILQNGTLKSLDIQYRVEGNWKDQIISEIQEIEDRQYLHRLVRKSDNKELAIALTEWA